MPDCGATKKVLGNQSLIRLYPRNSIAVLPELVRKVCCDHDALTLNNNKERFRSIVIEI